MRRSLFVALFLALFVAGCASLPLKERAVRATQAIHGLVATVDNAEMALCQPDPAAVHRCTSALAATAGLTDAKHVELSAKLIKAYRVEGQLIAAVKAWRAGDPAPTVMKEYLAIADEVLSFVESVPGLVSTEVVKSAREWVAAARTLDASFGGE